MEINRPVKTLATAITSSFEIDCPLYNWWWAPRSGGGTCHGETSFTLRYWISISIIIRPLRWLENNQASADNPPSVMPAKCCCCSCQLSVAELCRKCKSWCRLATTLLLQLAIEWYSRRSLIFRMIGNTDKRKTKEQQLAWTSCHFVFWYIFFSWKIKANLAQRLWFEL